MSGFSRVSISDSLRRTIQNIKEITGKHSDDDIYAMLKECNMDPNEAAQKLLYLDTFHEVKRKRDRRKVSVNNGAREEHRRIPGMQRRGTRDGNCSSYSSQDAAGGRQLNTRQENGYSNPMGRASKSMQVLKERKRVPAVASSTVPANGPTSICNGSCSHESITQLGERNARYLIKDAKTDYSNESRNLPSLRPVAVKQLPTLDPGPTPTPTPTNISTVTTRARIEGGSSKSKSSNLGNGVGSPSLSGLYSSASDPVLVPALNPRNPGSVGVIKCETGNPRNTAEISASLLATSKTTAVENVTTGHAVSKSRDLTNNTQPIENQGVNKSQLAESSQPPSSTSHHTAARQDRSSERETTEVDIGLHKLHISPKQSVIFPNHLHVPEGFKNALTFGSLDDALGQINEESNPGDAPSSIIVEASKEPSLTPQSSSPISGDSDYPDQSLSPPHVLGNLTSSQENVSSGAALRYDQSKQEMLKPVGRSHNPLLPPMPDYRSLVPPVSGSRFVQIEGLEPQGGNSPIPSTAGSASSMTQARGIAQSSVAVSPELFPFLRQPYPPNYIPYSPYFSQIYMPPQNAHPLLSHSGFPQQPSAGNMYMPPTAAAAGVKFPVPPVYKAGNLAGNLTHFGVSSGYVSYGASGLGYGSSSSLPPGTSSNDDISGSQKEKNMYSSTKQNEDLHALTSASGRDISALQTNVFYNLPQGQPLAFSPAQVAQNSFPGIYRPTQSMSCTSLVQSLQQSPPTGGTIESIVPPLSSYPQPQPHLLSLPQQQYGQMSWNQNFFNRENI